MQTTLRGVRLSKSTPLRPEMTRAWTGLNTTLMFGPSELTRPQREMIATVASLAHRILRFPRLEPRRILSHVLGELLLVRHQPAQRERSVVGGVFVGGHEFVPIEALSPHDVWQR
ncbi:MAG: hypothetical protein ACE5NA_09180 [Nitrospiraceae bacterium]